MGDNWNDIFNGLLFLRPWCYVNPKQRLQGGACSLFYPWFEVWRGLWNELLGCQRIVFM